MSSSPMRPLFRLGRFRVYWANRTRFTHPGVHLWTGSDHVRILPIPRKPR